MFRLFGFAVVLTSLIATGKLSAEPVSVTGSEITFESEITTTVDEKPTELVITGTALREKIFVNVYAMASYVQKGSKLKSAEELAKADIPKQLHLILERDVEGAKMAEAVNETIVANHSPDEFKEALESFLGFIKSDAIAKGDQVRITHIPTKGILCEILGSKPRAIQIENMQLSRAVWDIYFGKRNIGVAVKRNLVSRL